MTRSSEPRATRLSGEKALVYVLPQIMLLQRTGHASKSWSFRGFKGEEIMQGFFPPALLAFAYNLAIHLTTLIKHGSELKSSEQRNFHSFALILI